MTESTFGVGQDAWTRNTAGKRFRCKTCRSIIQSMHRHDFVRCKCGSVAVDGGSDYTRLVCVVGEVDDNIEEVKDSDVEGLKISFRGND